MLADPAFPGVPHPAVCCFSVMPRPMSQIEKDQFTVDRAGGGNAGVKSAVLERREEGDMGTTDSA